jgi:hypothetical protein
MFSLFFKKKYQVIGFEDVQFALQQSSQFILVNTLPNTEQICLIPNTLNCSQEETIINDLIANYEVRTKNFIVYGRNATDQSAIAKCEQLINVGFQNVYLYQGGIFEWLLLQDVYGAEEFPTSCKFLDLLKFKPSRIFGGYYLTR